MSAELVLMHISHRDAPMPEIGFNFPSDTAGWANWYDVLGEFCDD